MFIAHDPARLTKRLQLVAGLTGAAVGTPEYLKSGGQRGAVICYNRAVNVKRLVHISNEFMRLHPEVCSDIYHILQETTGFDAGSLKQKLAQMAAQCGRGFILVIDVWMPPSGRNKNSAERALESVLNSGCWVDGGR